MLVSVVHAEGSIKFKPIKTPWNTYEVKSDIINFDYQQMAYPAQKIEIGVHDNKTVVPTKREPGVANKVERSFWEFGSPLLAMIFGCFTALSLPILMSIIVSLVAKYYEKRNLEN
jgi:hypothetical protein